MHNDLNTVDVTQLPTFCTQFYLFRLFRNFTNRLFSTFHAFHTDIFQYYLDCFRKNSPDIRAGSQLTESSFTN